MTIRMIARQTPSSPAHETRPTRERLRVAQRSLDRLHGWGARIDQKSGLILGVSTGMIGVLASLAPHADRWTPALALCAGLTLLLIASSLLCMYLGTYPQTGRAGRSLFYFGAVAPTRETDFKRRFLALTRQDYLDDLLGRCHRNACIVAHKFTRLRWAYRLMFLGVVPWAVTLYLFKTA